MKQKKLENIQIFLYVIFTILFVSPALSDQTIIIGGNSQPSVEVNLEAIENKPPASLKKLTHTNEKNNLKIFLIPPKNIGKKEVIQKSRQFSIKKKKNYSDLNDKNSKIVRLQKKSNIHIQKIAKKNSIYKIKKKKILEKNKTATILKSPKNETAPSQLNKLEIAFMSETTNLNSKFHNDLSLLAQTSLKNKSRIQLRAYASNSGNSPSHARRVSLSRALTVRSFLIRKGVPSTNIDVRALGEPNDTNLKDRVDVVLLP